MGDKAAKFLDPQRARNLVELAEQALAELAEFAGTTVRYDATALQLLDEWIEREPSPPHALQVLWTAFLGEMFRRHYGGEWIVHGTDEEEIAVLCPTETAGVRRVDVAAQVARRIANGVSDSLALFYLYEGAALRRPEDL